MKYLVDSNFFIQAHRSTYPLDVVPSFWNKVTDLANQDLIISLDKVKNEIFQNDDPLKNWCDQHLPNGFFKDSTTCIEQYRQIATWAAGQTGRFVPAAIQEFLDADEADAWLVAYALGNNYTVITHEVSSPGIKKKIKIPEVCNQFNVPFMNTIAMMRALQQSF